MCSASIMYEAIVGKLPHLAVICPRAKALFRQNRYLTPPSDAIEAEMDNVCMEPLAFKLGTSTCITHDSPFIHISTLTKLPLAGHIETLNWVEVYPEQFRHGSSATYAQSLPSLKEVTLKFNDRDLKPHHLDMAKNRWRHVPKTTLYLGVNDEFLVQSEHFSTLKDWGNLHTIYALLYFPLQSRLVTAEYETLRQLSISLRKLFISIPQDVKYLQFDLFFPYGFRTLEQTRTSGEQMKDDLAARFPESSVRFQIDSAGDRHDICIVMEQPDRNVDKCQE